MTSEPLFPADLELVREVLRGRAAAREAFLQRSRSIPRILGLKNRRLGAPFSGSDLADLAQETFVQVWTNLASYRGSGCLDAWFYRFCCNVLGNALQRRSNRMESGAEPLDPCIESETEDFLETELLLAAIDGLGESSEEVICLKLLEGLTFEELARRLGISSNTAKTRYYRGVEQLRLRLESLDGGGRR